MKKNVIVIIAAVLVVGIILVLALLRTSPAPKITWNYSKDDVVGKKPLKTERIDIDVYLDATLSMQGFSGVATQTNNNFCKFIDGIDASIRTCWKESDPKYFMFGQDIEEINYNKFKSAKNDAAFYTNPKLFKITNIDLVVERTNKSRISVVVTDLFQEKADITRIVDEIRAQCFSRGVFVGILGMKSEYNGKVYDARVPPYAIKSVQGDTATYRSFFALIFAEPSNIEDFFSCLTSSSQMSFINKNNFCLVTPWVIEDYKVDVTKDKNSKNVQKIQSDPDNLQFNFDLKENSSEGLFLTTINFNRKRNTALFTNKFEMRVFKKSALPGSKKGPIDSILTDDIVMNNLSFHGQGIACNLLLKNTEPEGTYSYAVYLLTAAYGGFRVPGWVEELSSQNPSPYSDKYKTLNLSLFVEELLQASTSVYQPKIAKMHLTVRKK